MWNSKVKQSLQCDRDTLGTFSLPEIYSALFLRRVRRALSASAAARRLGLVPQDGFTQGNLGHQHVKLDEGASSLEERFQ